MDFVSGTFTGSGQTASIDPASPVAVLAALSIFGTFTGTVSLARSLDGGATYTIVAIDPSGTPASWTSPTSVDVELAAQGVLYQLQSSGWSAGTATWQMLISPTLTPVRGA